MDFTPCRRFRNPDVPTCLMKMAPDYCTVHVIHKGKAIQVKAAKAPAPFSTLPPKQNSQPSIESDPFEGKFVKKIDSTSINTSHVPEAKWLAEIHLQLENNMSFTG